MAEKYGFFKRIKDRLFKAKYKDFSKRESKKQDYNTQKEKNIEQRNNVHSLKTHRDPYFIQIGFDFGTSYSKCICRDVMTNKAWIYLPQGFENEEFPFLIPSTLIIRDEKLSLSKDPSREYHKNGLYHIKLALEKIALENWNDQVLEPYRNSLRSDSSKALQKFVINSGIYFLSKTFAGVKSDIKNRYSSFGQNEDDYIAINLAVPVADAEIPSVNNIFHKVLCIAWSIATEKKINNEMNVNELYQLVETYKKCSKSITDACYIYPEVSANVQGFIRSSVSKPGVYIFSDTGAGTVDQSVFIFNRNEEAELLTYLYASVLPFGSSNIEKHAASISGNQSCETLEKWRKIKEIGGNEIELHKARDRVHNDLHKGTKITLLRASQKLFVKTQLHDIRVIFGGGGYCEYPYKNAVMKAFNIPLFPNGYLPDVIGLPIPKDLEIEGPINRWMSRLTVAYGLSFVRTELANNIYPKDLRDPKPNEIQTVRVREIEEAPTKDVC